MSEIPEPLYGYGGSYGQVGSHEYSPPTPGPYDNGESELEESTLLPWWTFPRSSEFPGYQGQADLDVDLEVDPSWAWTWDRTLKALVLAPIVIFTIIGNFLVLYAFLRRKRDLRSPTHFFIANLSLADFLVGILAMPFLATLHTTDRWYFGPNFCYAWVIIHFWLCSASILSTLAVCGERYVGVKYPLRHIEIMSRQRVIGMILGVWGLAGFLSLISVLPFPEPVPIEGVGRFECRLNNQLGHVIIATVGILYIPATLMILLYWRIYIIASTHLKAIKGQNRGGDPGTKVKRIKPERPHLKTKTWSKLNLFRLSDTPTPSSEQLDASSKPEPPSSGENQCYSTGESEFSNFSTSDQLPQKSQPITPTIITISPGESTTTSGTVRKDTSQKQINLAKRLSLLVGILLFSYIPFFTAFLARGISPGSVPDPFFILLGWIRYSNSALNPVIYAYAVPSYRKALQSILLRRN